MYMTYVNQFMNIQKLQLWDTWFSQKYLKSDGSDYLELKILNSYDLFLLWKYKQMVHFKFREAVFKFGQQVVLPFVLHIETFQSADQFPSYTIKGFVYKIIL